VGIAVFGFIRSSSQHYSNFILAVVFLAGVLAIRNIIDDRRPRYRLVRTRMAIAIAGTLLATLGMAYIRWHADRLESTAPFFESTDLYAGYAILVGIMLLAYLHWGGLLTSVIVAAVLYFFFGHKIDSVLFTHPPYDPNFVLHYIGLGTTQGFFWLAQVAADSIYFLIVYAALLLGLGMLRMVLEVGKVSGRHISGGAAFPALVGSGIVASVMGQAVANVVMTGRFTIPMMKRHGFRASMAGAIESVASTAGQIMPPILGLAGFIIASFLNRPYIEVALSALIPGLLFLSGTTIGVLVYARRYALPTLTEPADTALVLRMLPTFLISFLVVLFLLLNYLSPAIAGVCGIAVALTLCLFQGRYRPERREFLESLEEGLALVTVLSLLLIAIGPLGQAMLTTNLSGRLGSVLVAILPDAPLVLLLGAMVVSLILGMGLPTPVAYIVVALAVVPFMQQLGVPPLQAHFFVFYFAVFSTLTPPVAVSVLAAARLADASLFTTALDAMKLSLTTFIVPFAFVYNPDIMSFPKTPWSVWPAVAEILLLQWAISISAYGHLRRALLAAERWVFALISGIGFFAVIDDNVLFSLFFAGMFGAMWLWIGVRKSLVPSGNETVSGK
jgi:TRAP transporter 4TM/12TM fusion protein